MTKESPPSQGCQVDVGQRRGKVPVILRLVKFCSLKGVVLTSLVNIC